MITLAALPGAARADALRILALGDSLTAGYGLGPGEGFPARLEAALRDRGYDVTVIDAGVSGDTASAAQARLEWSLGEGADAAIVELGGNDALRGLPPESTKKALGQIIEALQARDIPVLLAGMRAPPNLGPRYGETFDAIFPTLAKKYDILFYPFFLDGVAAEPDLNQADGIHPTAEGIEIIVQRIIPSVEALLDRAKSR
ncbi:arylesterase [Breoghania sp. L-A4]|uniref:arylesterase n=1 Tax=Breoghania sp. L-A4 TaxID=2304600 RepID=UPI0032046904